MSPATTRVCAPTMFNETQQIRHILFIRKALILVESIICHCVSLIIVEQFRCLGRGDFGPECYLRIQLRHILSTKKDPSSEGSASYLALNFHERMDISVSALNKSVASTL
jgi:hypothetical protein